MEVSELTTHWIHKERLDAMNKRVIGSQRYLEALQLIEDMYHGLKQKYGDAVSEKVQQMPGQPMIDDFDVSQCKTITREEMFGEPPFRKSIDARGNEKALDFEYDA